MRMRLAATVVIILLLGVSLAACTAYAQTAPTATPTRASPHAQTVTVTLTDTTITASQTAVQPGVRYDFIVTNHGTVAHQFWLMPAGMAQLMKQMPMAQWHRHLLASTQDIAPGKTAQAAYTFTTATMKHSWELGSYTPTTQSLVVPPA